MRILSSLSGRRILTAKDSAARAEISNSVVVSMTRMAPMSVLSMPPRRQIIGNSQRASAFLRLPIEARNQTPPSPMTWRADGFDDGFLGFDRGPALRSSPRGARLSLSRPRSSRRPAAMLAGIDDVFGRRQPRAIEPRECRGDILRRSLGEQGLRQHQILGRRLFREQRILQHALLVELADLIGLRRRTPARIDAGEIEQHFRAPLSRRRHQ